jgi:hypothetical protein
VQGLIDSGEGHPTHLVDTYCGAGLFATRNYSLCPCDAVGLIQQWVPPSQDSGNTTHPRNSDYEWSHCYPQLSSIDGQITGDLRALLSRLPTGPYDSSLTFNSIQPTGHEDVCIFIFISSYTDIISV